MSSSLRERIDHPVIDADGHTIEFMPQVAAYCREVAGSDVAQQFERSGCLDGLPLALEARANGGPGPAIRPPWWAVPFFAVGILLSHSLLAVCAVSVALLKRGTAMAAMSSPRLLF